MSRITEEFGANLRSVRRIRKMTQQQLADELQRYSVNVSVSTVSAWERGTRAATVEQLYATLRVLDAAPELLLGSHSLINESSEFWTKRKRDIVRYAAYEWEGDKRELWELVALYMCLPKEQRSDVAYWAAMSIKIAEDAGTLNREAPPPDLELLKNV